MSGLTGSGNDKSQSGGIADTLTDTTKGVTSTLGNATGGVTETAGGILGAAGKGLGSTVEGTTGSDTLGKPLSSVGQGLEDGSKSIGGGVKDAGKFGDKK